MNLSVTMVSQVVVLSFFLSSVGGVSSFPINLNQALNAIGFHWGYEAPPDAPQSDEVWTKCFEQVKEYHAEHKSFDIPLGSGHDSLAKWVRVQRSNKKKKQSKIKCKDLTKEREKLLDSIKFDWNGNRDIKFDSNAVTTKKTSSGGTAAAAATAAATVASKKKASKSSARSASSSSSSPNEKNSDPVKTSKTDDSKKKAKTKNGKKGTKKNKKNKKDTIVEEDEQEGVETDILPEPVPLKDINSRGDNDNNDMDGLQLYDWRE